MQIGLTLRTEHISVGWCFSETKEEGTSFISTEFTWISVRVKDTAFLMLPTAEIQRVTKPDYMASAAFYFRKWAYWHGKGGDCVERAHGLSPPHCSAWGGRPHCYLPFLFLSPPTPHILCSAESRGAALPEVFNGGIQPGGNAEGVLTH